MTDITTKLRSLARWLRQLAAHEPEPECKASHIECAGDCSEAADEIDRLRAELEGYAEANKYMKGELDDAMEDARKYAEAKREVARRVEDAYREAVDTLNPCFATAGAMWEGSNARKQLEAK